VVWLAAEPVRPSMVLVVLEMPHEPAADPAATDHYGFAVDTRERVDRIAELARAEKRLKYGPADGGPIVGLEPISKVSKQDADASEMNEP
jgi:hypothetical protein